MTRVEAFFADEKLLGLRIQGHTGFAPQGEDLVCAAVSAIAQTAILGLRAFALDADILQDEERALIDIGLSREKSDRAQAILQTALLGLEDLAAGMPQYVQVLHKKRRWKA